MSISYLPGACNVISSPFFWESRLSFVGVKEVRLKEGIRFHNFITAFILRLLFGDQKIVDIKDVDGKVYYLNRGSLSNWLNVNRGKVVSDSVRDTLNTVFRATWSRSELCNFLKKKSPQSIVKISKIKNELVYEESQQKIAAGRGDNLSIADQARPTEIAQLKEELARLQVERAALK